MSDAVDVIGKMIRLFGEYRESLGLTNADFPDDKPEDRAQEFEDKFCELICEYRGHDLVPDQCMKPEHYYCTMCNRRRDEIEER